MQPSTTAPTIKEAITSYLHRMQSSDSPQLHTAKSQALALFHSFLIEHHKLPQHTSIAQLTTDHAITFLHYLQETRSIETEHLYSRSLLSFYNALIAQYHSLTPAAFEHLQHYFSQHRRHKTHTLPDPPLQAITLILQVVKNAPPPVKQGPLDRRYLQHLRDKALLTLLAETGLRATEACSARKSHLTGAMLKINTAILLPISPTCRQFLTHYLSERATLDNSQPQYTQQDLPLFARHDKRASKRILPISRWTIANIIDEWATFALTPNMLAALQTNNQPITPNTFRHYFVITTLQQTDDIQTTMHLARHKDRATTHRYLRQFPKPHA